jgi:hypothetical protein
MAILAVIAPLICSRPRISIGMPDGRNARYNETSISINTLGLLVMIGGAYLHVETRSVLVHVLNAPQSLWAAEVFWINSGVSSTIVSDAPDDWMAWQMERAAAGRPPGMFSTDQLVEQLAVVLGPMVGALGDDRLDEFLDG